MYIWWISRDLIPGPHSAWSNTRLIGDTGNLCVLPVLTSERACERVRTGMCGCVCVCARVRVCLCVYWTRFRDAHFKERRVRSNWWVWRLLQVSMHAKVHSPDDQGINIIVLLSCVAVVACVCVCAREHVCANVRACARARVCVCAFVRVFMDSCVCVCVQMRESVSMSV